MRYVQLIPGRQRQCWILLGVMIGRKEKDVRNQGRRRKSQKEKVVVCEKSRQIRLRCLSRALSGQRSGANFGDVWPRQLTCDRDPAMTLRHVPIYIGLADSALRPDDALPSDDGKISWSLLHRR